MLFSAGAQRSAAVELTPLRLGSPLPRPVVAALLPAAAQGGVSATLARVVLRARRNRVVYARGGLSEWYANGRLGFERGFALNGGV